jgi:hypothetical protein
MILGFKTHFPDGTPTDFERKILEGEKIHTLRLGHRWKPGTPIQMANGVRTTKYRQFNKKRPDLAVCKSVQTFWLKVSEEAPYEELKFEILIDKARRYSSPCDFTEAPGLISTWESWERQPDPHRAAITEQFALLAKNDGLQDVFALFDWFRPSIMAEPGQPWERRIGGQIIHWTDFRY